MSELFIARNDLNIGHIVEVSGNSLRIELDKNISELTRAIDGQVYPIGQMGSVIKIHFGRKVLFAFVRLLRMRSEALDNTENFQLSPNDDARILEADLFGQEVWSNSTKKLNFTRGVETYPLPLQQVYLCLNEELESVYKAAEINVEKNSVSPMVPIGNYVGVIMPFVEPILINYLDITLLSLAQLGQVNREQLHLYYIQFWSISQMKML